MKHKGGSHALRKRCPICRKSRKFHEPPGDQGGNRVLRYLKWKPVIEGLGFICDRQRPLWIKTPFGWGCVHCALRLRPNYINNLNLQSESANKE